MHVLPLFASLSLAEIDLLLQSATVKKVPGKTLLLREGEQASSLLVLLDGLVQMTATRPNHNAAILMLKPPSCFVIAAVLCNDTLVTSVQTVLESRLVAIQADLIRRLFAENAGFARAAACEISMSYRNAMRELLGIRTRTGFQRLVAWILAMQADSRTPSEIEMPFDKGLLAARLGMKPETLSRSLSRLAEFGITVSQRKLHIANAAKLRKYAKANRLYENVLLP